MLELKAGAFVEAVNRLSESIGWLHATEDSEVFAKDGNLKEDVDRDFARSRILGLADYLNTLGANVTALAVEDMDEYIGKSWANWGGVRERYSEIRNSLRRELSLSTVLIIESEKRAFFVPSKPLFGADFDAKFKSHGAFELDEAAKCLALSRPTAAVFHMMRLMEIGIRSVSACLGIPDPVKPADRNWGKMLDTIWTKGIEKKWPTTSDRLGGDGKFFEEVYASLEAVKNPWRNSTMHVENKYTDDEAENIYAAVRGFMMKLASRCDENGKPTA